MRRTQWVGALRIETCMDPALRRQTEDATIWLHGIGSVGERPKLRDVKLVGMSIQAFVISGFERINDVEYMQSCYCQPCD